MREIEFRFWDLVDGKYNDYCMHIAKGKLKSTRIGIFEQYTGLKDKNGKKIFEGDILRLKAEEGGKLISFDIAVYYSTDEAGFYVKEEGESYLDGFLLEKEFTSNLEIVGIIHDKEK